MATLRRLYRGVLDVSVVVVVGDVLGRFESGSSCCGGGGGGV